MFKTIRILLIATFVVLGIASCSSPAAEATPSMPDTPLPSTSTPTPPRPTASPAMTPTTDYCSSHGPEDVLLPVSDAQGWSEEEIARWFVEQRLVYINDPQAPDVCRIEGYSIDEVDCDISSFGIDPKGDFLCLVLDSYKPVTPVSAAVPGYLDEQNWFHSRVYVAVFRSNRGYTMKFAGP
jgi:hypothetical protein